MRRQISMDEKTKILFIGLDSVDPVLLKKLIRSGELPVLGALWERGLWGEVSNFPGFGNGVYWPCFFTGVNPGRHGRYFVYQIATGSYHITLFDDDNVLKCEPFWSVLGRAGKRVAIIDVFRAPLTKDLNGIQVSDWTAHSPPYPPRSWPPELISDVIERYGADPLNGNCDAYGPDPDDYVKLVHQLLDRVEMKTRMSCDYLERGGWDLFLTVFAEAHDIGHRAWHLHDTAHILHNPEWVRRHGDPVKAVYVGLDHAVGRLLDNVGPGTTVVVLAGLGIEPDYTANHLMDDILCRIEFGPDANPAQSIKGRITAYRKFVPPGVRRFIRRSVLKKRFVLSASDWHRRKFFAIPHDENSGAVRINVIGRESRGVIEPGEEYDVCCETLTKDLLDIVNLHTGEPIIGEVVKVADICDGAHVGDLPDLLAVWHRPKPISAVASPRIGEIRKPYPGTRTGDHTANGMFLAQGPTVARGDIRTPVRVTALAPTIAALLNVELPQTEEAPLAHFRSAREGGIGASAPRHGGACSRSSHNS